MPSVDVDALGAPADVDDVYVAAGGDGVFFVDEEEAVGGHDLVEGLAGEGEGGEEGEDGGEGAHGDGVGCWG